VLSQTTQLDLTCLLSGEEKERRGRGGPQVAVEPGSNRAVVVVVVAAATTAAEVAAAAVLW